LTYDDLNISQVRYKYLVTLMNRSYTPLVLAL